MPPDNQSETLQTKMLLGMELQSAIEDEREEFEATEYGLHDELAGYDSEASLSPVLRPHLADRSLIQRFRARDLQEKETRLKELNAQATDWLMGQVIKVEAIADTQQTSADHPIIAIYKPSMLDRWQRRGIHPSRITGIIMGIDLSTATLTVKPEKQSKFSRKNGNLKVKVLDEYGEPRVDVSFLSK